MIVKNKVTLILAATALLTLTLGTLAFLYPPALFPDTSWGFQVLRGMRMGGAFNMLNLPDANDISKNSSSFLAWWSPGQYLFPYFFISLFHLKLGQAIVATITLCSLLGLLGFHLFFRQAGFSKTVSAIAVAFIACQQAFFIPYIFYNGGETLLFAFAGWFLYGCLYFGSPNWKMSVFILLSGIIGFICKSSFLWMFFTGVLYLWLINLRGKSWKQIFINSCYTGIPFIVSVAVIYYGYILKGINPASSYLGFKFASQAITFPLASPILTVFSVDDITGGLLYHIGPAPFNHLLTILIIIAFAVLSIVLIARMVKSTKFTNYNILLICFYIIAALFFASSFLRQADISYEARHLHIIGLIITPGLINLLAIHNKKWQTYLFGFIWLLILITGVIYAFEGFKRNHQQTAHGYTGVAHLFIDQGTLNYVQVLDKQHHNAIFAFIGPDLGLEIRNNRIISFNPVNDKLEVENMDTYYGHSGPIYLILPESYKGPKAQVYLKCFPAYKHISITNAGKGYLVYSLN